LLTKIHKGYQEFVKVGLISETKPKIYGAQATGCSPISAAQKAGLDFFKPVKPDTIAKSLAIGTPADGFYALKVMRDTGGSAEDVTDDEIRDAIKLLAETEGIFAETAGGVTVGVAKKLIASGKIPRDESAVICVTGNGLKTLDAVSAMSANRAKSSRACVNLRHCWRRVKKWARNLTSTGSVDRSRPAAGRQ
jgi:threonine synthase